MTELQPAGTNSVCQVRTSFSKFTYVFSWQIENYANWPFLTKVTSPEFHLNDQAFHATLEILNKRTYVSERECFLTFYALSQPTIKFKLTVSITDRTGKVFSEKSQDFEKTSVFAFLTDSVVEYSNSAKDHVLIFKCTMEIDKLCTEIEWKYPIATSPENMSILIDNLKSMYTSSLHADINLQVGDEVVRVHKSLLCARSPVFANMFESSMEENEKNTIAIPDIELPVMKNILEFLYTGKLLAEDFESVYSLYYAADKYDVSNLRKTCVGILLSKMDVENACRVLSLANQHSDDQFKDLAMDFVQFHFDEIVETDSWEEFLEEETKLAADVMKRRIKNGKKISDAK